MGSGVADALRRANGEEINRDAVKKGPVDLGEVAIGGEQGRGSGPEYRAAFGSVSRRDRPPTI